MTGKLLSVNVGLPREIEWLGRVERTSIWKAPVEGRVAVRGFNVAGDEQAAPRGTDASGPPGTFRSEPGGSHLGRHAAACSGAFGIVTGAGAAWALASS